MYVTCTKRVWLSLFFFFIISQEDSLVQLVHPPINQTTTPPHTLTIKKTQLVLFCLKMHFKLEKHFNMNSPEKKPPTSWISFTRTTIYVVITLKHKLLQFMDTMWVSTTKQICTGSLLQNNLICFSWYDQLWQHTRNNGPVNFYCLVAKDNFPQTTTPNSWVI